MDNRWQCHMFINELMYKSCSNCTQTSAKSTPAKDQDDPNTILIVKD